MKENRPNLNHLTEEKQKKLRKFDWLFLGGAAAGLAVAAYCGCQNGCQMPDLAVYEGKINDVAIIYEEGRSAEFSDFGNFKQNVMVLKKGRQTFELYDLKNETSIDWGAKQKPNFETDQLEEIVIHLGSGERRRFFASDIGLGTEEGEMAKEMFAVMNPFYNSLRDQIREIKRKEAKLDP